MSLVSELVGPTVDQNKGFKQFLLSEIGTDRGPYTFQDRISIEKMVDIIAPLLERRVPDAEVVIVKGAQTGVSTLAVGLGAFVPAQLQRNLGYYLPTQEFADRFGATRFSAAVRRSPLLSDMMRNAKVRGIDQKGLKQFGEHYLYTLGLESIISAISIPLDAMLYDEVDIIPKENMEWSDDRIAASDWRFRMYFCVPMFPGAGIDGLYRETSQRRWFVRCEACNRWQELEESFPANVVLKDGHYVMVCGRCGSELDRGCGDWVAARTDARSEGFRLSQLAVPAVSMDYIMRRWEKAKDSKSKLAKFRCSALAIPDAGDMQPITDEVLRSASGDYDIEFGSMNGPRFAGVDTGDEVHFACHELLPDGRKRFIYFEEMDSDTCVERINRLWGLLKLSGLVCDSKPQRSVARGIADAHPGMVWLQDFADGELREKASEHHGREYVRVLVDREESLDDLADLFLAEPSRILLPGLHSESKPVLAAVHSHLKALQKERIQDAKGNTVNKYKRAVANHFAMAMNSSITCEHLALGRRRDDGPVEYQSVSQRRFASRGGF
jgi:hypothetical protein